MEDTRLEPLTLRGVSRWMHSCQNVRENGDNIECSFRYRNSVARLFAIIYFTS